MAFPKLIPFSILGGTGGLDFYIPVPVRCTIKTIQAACAVDPGDGETITVYDGSNEVGVLTYGSTIAAGATGTYAKNATYGNSIFDAGDVVKLSISALTAASNFSGWIEVDEFCRV